MRLSSDYDALDVANKVGLDPGLGMGLSLGLVQGYGVIASLFPCRLVLSE